MNNKNSKEIKSCQNIQLFKQLNPYLKFVDILCNIYLLKFDWWKPNYRCFKAIHNQMYNNSDIAGRCHVRHQYPFVFAVDLIHFPFVFVTKQTLPNVNLGWTH